MKSVPCLLAVLATVLVLAFGVAPASADDVPEPGDRAASFQAVTGARAEDVPGGPLLLGAYGLVWLLTMGYLFRVGSLESRLSADVEALAKQIEEASRTKGS